MPLIADELFRGKKCLDTEIQGYVFFPQELQFRVLDDLDVSRKGRPPLKYILSRTMGFWGSGSFFPQEIFDQGS